MVTDYEAAFIALGEYVASKTQHGREGLLTKMAEIAAEHRVPAGELSRLFRLYGVEVERARSVAADTSRDDLSGSRGDSLPARTGGSPAIIDRGGHDGSRSRREDTARV